mmetsp:Transcript_70899/g.140646  ORF Transcript_70899/g.140646 Transcript_70899/m.140646 type:complete len:325 (-) Transcript_70899:90-1064(-)
MLRRVLRHRHAIIWSAAASVVVVPCGGRICWLQEQGHAQSKELCQEHHSSLLHPDQRLKALDAVLAGIGLFGGCSILGRMEQLLGLKLFAPPMMASGLIFFVGPTPPHPQGFLSGTLCSATVSFGTLRLLSPLLQPVAAQGAAAASLLIWFKATSAIFPPAAVLAGALASASLATARPSATAALEGMVRYLCFPWLAGHAWLYVCAYAMADLRRHVRVEMSKERLNSFADHTDEELLRVFEKFDTSGDGFLDPEELKIALRVALSVDLTISDCESLVGEADRDGNGVVDFEEFKIICRECVGGRHFTRAVVMECASAHDDHRDY